MKHLIIKTDNYLLIVSDEEIKEKDWYIDDCNEVRQSVTNDKDYWHRRPDYKKIIAHLPLNDTAILEGVLLLPDVLIIPNEQTVYSEEDLRKAIKMAWEANSIDGTVDLNIVLHYGNNNDLRTKWSEDEIIQSLKQPKTPTYFLLERIENNKCIGKYLFE